MVATKSLTSPEMTQRNTHTQRRIRKPSSRRRKRRRRRRIRRRQRRRRRRSILQRCLAIEDDDDMCPFLCLHNLLQVQWLVTSWCFVGARIVRSFKWPKRWKTEFQGSRYWLDADQLTIIKTQTSRWNQKKIILRL